MPIINRMAELHGEIAAWRHDFHRNPELLYDVHETARAVAGHLRDFGCDEIAEGIGRTGVVAVINGRGDGPTIALRADMDALPITEESGVEWSSHNPGKMHACGHDGHTAMLLGAARYLAETRNFSGKAVVVFQPAEEGGAGAKAMIDDNFLERFGIEEVYGMHNMPGMPVGQFAIRPGPILAAADEFSITFTGKGGHAAYPHFAVDPVVMAAQCVLSLQTIVSRNTNPLDSLVISATEVHAGTAHNIIADQAVVSGTVRSLKKEVQEMAVRRMGEVAEGIAAAFGGKSDFHFHYGYPVTVNHPEQTEKAIGIALSIAGDGAIETSMSPNMGGEDFSFMLEARPGAFIWVGNGDTAQLHNARYDFNDEAIPFGTSYWAKLVETLMPAR
jgi:amidohydrolase